jgi:hypothetical protein
MEQRVKQRQKGSSFKEFRKDVILGLGIIAIGLAGVAFANYKTRPLVDAAIQGREIPCQEGAFESSLTRGKADVLAVLGGGFTDGDGIRPNTLEKERLSAAAKLTAAGYVRLDGHIIFLDDLPEGETINPNPSYFQNQVTKITDGTVHIAPARMHVVNTSVNTPKNMDDLEKFIYGTKWNVLVVTHKSHIKRAELDAKIRGFCPAFISVEDVMGMYDPVKAKALKRRANAGGEIGREIKESAGLLMHYLDPYMGLSTLENQIQSGH